MHPLHLPQTSTAKGPSQVVHAPAMCLSPRYCWHLVARSCLEGPSQMLQASLIAVRVAVLLVRASLIAELVAAPASLIAASLIPCRLRSLLRSWMVPAMFLEVLELVLGLQVVLLRELVETVGHMQPMVVDPVRTWVLV